MFPFVILDLYKCTNIGIANNKSRSIHNLTGSTDQSFYQNLSVYRAQNQSQPNLGERYVYIQSIIYNFVMCELNSVLFN